MANNFLLLVLNNARRQCEYEWKLYESFPRLFNQKLHICLCILNFLVEMGSWGRSAFFICLNYQKRHVCAFCNRGLAAVTFASTCFYYSLKLKFSELVEGSPMSTKICSPRKTTRKISHFAEEDKIKVIFTASTWNRLGEDRKHHESGKAPKYN